MTLSSSAWLVHCVILCLLFNSCLGQFQRPFSSQNQIHQDSKGKNAPRGSCPEKNGRFPVASQCDAYTECIDGIPEEKLCPEGLVFNPDARFNYPCGYPIDVDCEGRPNLQPAQPTDECPHQFGYFKVGDKTNCGQFINCADGRAYIFDCPEGLAYNSQTYRCDWPDQVEDCDAEAYLGFSCPLEKGPLPAGDIRFFKSPVDCQRYYICVNGKPRLMNCGDGYAFDDITNTCEDVANVTGCPHQGTHQTSLSHQQGTQQNRGQHHYQSNQQQHSTQHNYQQGFQQNHQQQSYQQNRQTSSQQSRQQYNFG